MKDRFSTLDIEKNLRIKRERLRAWMARGFIVPTYASTGQGRAAGFTFDDLCKVAIFRELIECGLRGEAAATVISVIESGKLLQDIKLELPMNVARAAIRAIGYDVPAGSQCDAQHIVVSTAR